MGGEISTAAAFAGALDRELVIVGWICNGLLVACLILGIGFLIALWMEKRDGEPGEQPEIPPPLPRRTPTQPSRIMPSPPRGGCLFYADGVTEAIERILSEEDQRG